MADADIRVRAQVGGFTLKGLTADPANIYAKGPSRVDGYYKQKATV